MAEREPFIRLTSSVTPLDRANVDTDQILPARFLKLSRDKGLGQVLFHDVRLVESGAPDPDFPVGNPRYADARILLAGDNFGSGSSREAAVYALYDHGFRCVIAPSFGSIFYGNALRNGLLPVALPMEEVARLQELARMPDGLVLSVDLEETEVVLPSGESLGFSVPALQRILLLTGKEELDVTLERSDEIHHFAAEHEAANPWVIPSPPNEIEGAPA